MVGASESVLSCALRTAFKSACSCGAIRWLALPSFVTWWGSRYSFSSSFPHSIFPSSKVILHIWVMVVLLTYQPEMHTDHSSVGFHPQHPEVVAAGRSEVLPP